MSGIGEAASIVSFISVGLQLFDGCIKGFALLSSGLEFGSRAEKYRCQLDWEHYRLYTWATTVGLFKVPPELNVSNPNLVQQTLEALAQLLTDLHSLETNYQLKFRITEEEIRHLSTPKRFFGQKLGKTKPQFVSDTAAVFSRRNHAWKKFTWAAYDNERIKILLQDIQYFNERLQDVLHPTDRNLATEDGVAVLRHIVAQGPDRPSLEAMEGPLRTVDAAVNASARLRRKGLQLDLIPPAQSVASDSTSPSHLTPYPSVSSRRSSPSGIARAIRKDPALLSPCQRLQSVEVTQEIALYSGKTVILEWKDVAHADEAKLKYRIAAVASLLMEMESISFHSLPCLGYLKEPKMGRYAYIFSPPPLVQLPLTMKSLRDLLSDASWRPSLTSRFKVALVLAEAILQLHTAGWLHKDIRPGNVLFCKTTTDDWSSEKDLPSAYLGGYGSARADNPLESTEAPLAHKDIELYRHPRSLGHARSSFTKRFDLYSLGCVLIEIGFCLPLYSILLQHCTTVTNPPNSSTFVEMGMIASNGNAEYYTILRYKASLLGATGQGSIISELGFLTGEAYSKIVATCLTAAEWSVDDEFDDSIEIQERNVGVLRKLTGII